MPKRLGSVPIPEMVRAAVEAAAAAEVAVGFHIRSHGRKVHLINVAAA
jgi:hypothetical protein